MYWSKNIHDAASSAYSQREERGIVRVDMSQLYEAYLLGCEDECIPEPKTIEQFSALWGHDSACAYPRLPCICREELGERGQEGAKPLSRCAKCGTEISFHGDSWYHLYGKDVMKCGVAIPASTKEIIVNEQMAKSRTDEHYFVDGKCKYCNLSRVYVEHFYVGCKAAIAGPPGTSSGYSHKSEVSEQPGYLYNVMVPDASPAPMCPTCRGTKFQPLYGVHCSNPFHGGAAAPAPTKETHEEDCPCWGDSVEHSEDCRNCTCEKKPANPSPTPWDFSTWGFYCDMCKRFFDSSEQLGVLCEKEGISYEHKTCGNVARYIGYDHRAVNPEPSVQPSTQCWHKEIKDDGICKACGAKAAIKLPFSPEDVKTGRVYSNQQESGDVLRRISHQDQASEAKVAVQPSTRARESERFADESGIWWRLQHISESERKNVFEFVEAYADKRLAQATDKLLEKLGWIRQSGRASDRFSTPEYHGFRVACEEFEAAIRSLAAEEKGAGS